ncbi:MAG: hypothetical protein AAF089_08030 [Bacteroidota bacterium]
MGKLTLLIALATVLGSTLVVYTARTSAFAAASDRAEAQADMIARQAAQAGHNLVLGAMLDDYGFKGALDFQQQAFQGGAFEVDYKPTTDGQSLTFEVTGVFDGATHRVTSRYNWIPADFPGPIWIDAPYVTADLTGSTITGGPGQNNVYYAFDRFEKLRLSPLVSFQDMRDAFATELDAVRSSGASLRLEDTMDAIVEYTGALSLETLYMTALGAIERGDVVLDTSSPVVTGSATYGSAAEPAIVYKENSMELTGTIRGYGLLIVDGTLEVTGTLDWDGLVLVRSFEDFLPVRFPGRVTIDGALLIDQYAAPPGGHIDLTVFRDPSGLWTDPHGDLSQSPWQVHWARFGQYPWHQHTHKFNESVAEENTIYFAEQGTDRHETQTAFRATLNSLGAEEVYLEVANADNASGLAEYTLNVQGEPTSTGQIKVGFDGTVRSPTFRANRLDDFILDVRSMRMLRELVDEEGDCDEWPKCVGNQRDRAGALSVRLRRASNDGMVYEAAIYWHQRGAERQSDAQEERRWRRRINNGQDFGARLEMGANDAIHFDMGPIIQLGRRLGFASPGVQHLGTNVQHQTPMELRSAELDDADALKRTMCVNGTTREVYRSVVQTYLNQGATLGTCSSNRNDDNRPPRNDDD